MTFKCGVGVLVGVPTGASSVSGRVMIRGRSARCTVGTGCVAPYKCRQVDARQHRDLKNPIPLFRTIDSASFIACVSLIGRPLTQGRKDALCATYTRKSLSGEFI
jgi:hypothetical protein